MKIIFVSHWYSENMGYIENCLPRALVKQGHEVYVVTSTAQVYYNHPFYKETYQKHLGDAIQPAGKRIVDGVHNLPFTFCEAKKYHHTEGLISTVNDINQTLSLFLNMFQ